MFNKSRPDNERDPTKHRINCYAIEVKLKGIQGDPGWKNGRVFATNAFKATTLISARDDIAEIYLLRRIRGDFSDKEQCVQFDE
jgi:hypothetical protein